MFLVKPMERDYELVMPVVKTIEDLRESLNLPKECELTDMNIIDYVDNMRNQDYSTLLFMRYILGYSFKRIEKEGNIYYASMSSACQNAIRVLRKEILEDLSPENIGNRPINDIAYHKIGNSLGLTGKTLYESIEWLLKFDYKPCKNVDMLVHSIQSIDPKFVYPQYLLKKPHYPYNLYAQILRGEIGGRGSHVRDVQSKYLKMILTNPQYNVGMYVYHVKDIFSDKNTLLRSNEKEILKFYYKNELSIKETSEKLNISESLLKSTIQRSLKLFNTVEGIHFIHTGKIK